MTDNKNCFEILNAIDVSEKTEKKNKLTYLSWAWAWGEFLKVCPDATYKVVKNDGGLPYFADEPGVMVYTEVTAEGITREMWLPVMNGANKAMKNKPYTYSTNYGDKEVEAYTMFDINKTLMRCLTKNLAMFGVALYIYAGEDLPEEAQAEKVEADKLEAKAKKLAKAEAERLKVEADAEASKEKKYETYLANIKKVDVTIDSQVVWIKERIEKWVDWAGYNCGVDSSNQLQDAYNEKMSGVK